MKGEKNMLRIIPECQPVSNCVVLVWLTQEDLDSRRENILFCKGDYVSNLVKVDSELYWK